MMAAWWILNVNISQQSSFHFLDSQSAWISYFAIHKDWRGSYQHSRFHESTPSPTRWNISFLQDDWWLEANYNTYIRSGYSIFIRILLERFEHIPEIYFETYEFRPENCSSHEQHFKLNISNVHKQS